MDNYLCLDEYVVLCDSLRGLLFRGDDNGRIDGLLDIGSGLFNRGFILMDNNYLITRGSSTWGRGNGDSIFASKWNVQIKRNLSGKSIDTWNHWSSWTLLVTGLEAPQLSFSWSPPGAGCSPHCRRSSWSWASWGRALCRSRWWLPWSWWKGSIFCNKIVGLIGK